MLVTERRSCEDVGCERIILHGDSVCAVGVKADLLCLTAAPVHVFADALGYVVYGNVIAAVVSCLRLGFGTDKLLIGEGLL